jgi:hypothetical protein
LFVYYKTFFRNGLILVLLSSLSNKTILHNEKTFQNNWFYYSYLIIAVVVFLYFVSTPLPEGQQGAKAEALTDKFKQPSIKQLGILPPPFLLALEKSPLSLGQKTQLSSSEWGDKKVLYNANDRRYRL